MTDKTILFLTKRFYTNKDLVGDRFGRNYYLPVELARLGNKVFVIAWDYKTSSNTVQIIDNVTFISLSCRGIGFFCFFFKTIEHIRKLKPNYIIGSGDTYFGFFAVYLSRLFKAASVFDVYDFYPAFGSNRIPGFKRLFYKMLGLADIVYSASMPLLRLAENYRNKAFFIPNAVDENTFEPMSKQSAKLEVGLQPDCLYIGYFGSMAKERGTLDLLEAFRSINLNGKSVRLLLAGKFEEEIKVDFTHVDYLGFLSQSEIVKYIAACDVVTLPYHESDLIQYGNSCKTMEYIACSRPIVASKVNNILENYPELRQLPEQQFFSIPADVKDLKRALEWQLESQYVLPLSLVVHWRDLAKELNSVFE